MEAGGGEHGEQIKLIPDLNLSIDLANLDLTFLVVPWSFVAFHAVKIFKARVLKHNSAL